MVCPNKVGRYPKAKINSVAKKPNFLEIDTSNDNGKAQDSNSKGQMSYLFCPLPLPFSVMVTGQDGDTGENIMSV